MGITAVPREIENNDLAKFWGGGGANNVHYENVDIVYYKGL